MNVGQEKTPPGREAENEVEAESAAEHEDLIGFARAYFATDFPNPTRAGCPSRATLLAQACSAELPAEELRAHLFGCSECFNEYRAALQPHRTEQATPARWWQWPTVKAGPPLFKLGWALACASVLAAIIFWGWYAQRQPAPVIQAQQGQRPSETAIADQPKHEQPPPATKTASSASPPPATAARQAVEPNDKPQGATLLTVDLSLYAALRSPGMPSQPQSLQLPRKRLQLQLALPEGSLAGSYLIALSDNAGREWLTIRARSREGKQLLIPFDLTRIAPGNYRLSLRHSSGETDVYPVGVAEQNKPAHSTP